MSRELSPQNNPSPPHNSNTRHISEDSIELPQTINKKIPKHRNHSTIQQILVENHQLKTHNKFLKKQLENLSQRLDQELHKRFIVKKPQSRPEDVTHMELQNAYKKIDIYKREVSFYKKKLDFKEQREHHNESLDERLENFTNQNQNLKNQVKQLNKIIKVQEKGLTELGTEGYLKIVDESEKMKEEIRKLKKQLDEYRRVDNRNFRKSEKVSRQNENHHQAQNHLKQLTRVERSSKLEENLKQRIKTEHHEGRTEKNDGELLDLLQKKVEKDYIKIKSLVNEKDKIREMLDNTKAQLQDKDKEITFLKEKIISLRKMQLHKNTQPIDSKVSSEVEHEELNKSRQKSHKNEMQSKTNIKEVKENKPKYPRIEEYGKSQQNSMKWNDHQFSSKIKEIQIIPHADGHIKDIHVRYQKGEVNQVDHKQKYSVFICAESNEFIKQINGGFMDGYLQYLQFTTSMKRVAKYCKYELAEEQSCQNFSFQIREDEYPCALFGEKDSGGVVRLGCFIDKV